MCTQVNFILLLALFMVMNALWSTHQIINYKQYTVVL